MPDSDEYFVIAEERLDTLAERRHNEFYEGALFCGGIAVGAIIPTGVALWDWAANKIELTPDGFLNCLLFAAAGVGAAIFWRLWSKDKNTFTALLDKIKAGKRYGIAPGSDIPLRPASKDHGDRAG